MKPLFLLPMKKIKRMKKKRSSQPLSAPARAVKKYKRTCIKSSQQQSLSSQQHYQPDFYLPDNCWEHVFTFLIEPVDPLDLFALPRNPRCNRVLIENEDRNNFIFQSLSLVSKQFLSIINTIIFSIRVYHPQLCLLPRFFHRFSNLNSLDLWFRSRDLHAGVALALRDRPLKSLSISWIELMDANYITSCYIDSFLSLKSLNSLEFYRSRISDELLYAIAREGLPLNKFLLERCMGYSYHGIYDLLSKCHGIQHLGLQGVDFLNNHHVSLLSLLLPDLISINLNTCSKLTESALFVLIKNCHSLAEIKMEHIFTKRDNVENTDTLKDFHVNPQLKFLYFKENSFINDQIIIVLASIFPNLQFLDLSYCYSISGKSICQVLSRCFKVKYMHLACCIKVRPIKMNFVIPQLEVLNLSGTSVDDKTLYQISKNCVGLLKLFLISCKYVTENGVMHVLGKCRQLKNIILARCDKVNADVVLSMLSPRPSLGKYKCCNFAGVWLKF
ncbi:SCF E3 ubiquitin ligase complex F-box protein grrA-like [Vicia villosa]|uniref:SCF E3 ubiquitin ligase complex F-box protein grrA-like n=1 Tax=Vicia villosa TaxID=3911 RepID=UPI00273ACBA9|nr:SCF E3 ubiquitin ligase complex F-box protein grrA-like [Vicia villosa]